MLSKCSCFSLVVCGYLFVCENTPENILNEICALKLAAKTYLILIEISSNIGFSTVHLTLLYLSVS